MASRNQVKRLRQCVVEAISKDTISRFISLFSIQHVATAEESPPSPKRTRTDESVENTVLLARQQVIDIIGGRLNEFLVGSYSSVKQWMVDHFINTYCCRQSGGDGELCLAFFRCLLDESFTTFSFSGKPGYPLVAIDPMDLLLIVCEQSPFVQSLELSFGSHQIPLAFNHQFGQTLFSLNRLTVLKLSCISGTNCLGFFTALGNSCPKLTVLKLHNFSWGTLEFLALFLGPQLNLVPQSLQEAVTLYASSDEDLAYLEFSPDSLTPICNSLKELSHVHRDYRIGTCVLCDSTSIFVLRHLRQLENIDHQCNNHDSVVDAVQFLHQEQSSSCSQNEDDDLVTTVTRSSEQLGCISYTYNPIFTGI